MNLLAQVVQDLIQGNDSPDLKKLPLNEQKALADLKALLELSPEELARNLGRQQKLPSWGRSIQFISET